MTPAGQPPLWIEAGDLAQVMERLVDYIEERNGLRGKILTAFIYPGVVGLVSIGIAYAMSGFGIVAAVLGIVVTMASLGEGDQKSIGLHVGAALVGTSSVFSRPMVYSVRWHTPWLTMPRKS